MKFITESALDHKLDFVCAFHRAIDFERWWFNDKKIHTVHRLNHKTRRECEKNYTPVGSIDFVREHLLYHFGKVPKPINVPEELFPYAGRYITNGTDQTHYVLSCGAVHLKSNDEIKGYSTVIYHQDVVPNVVPAGNYQTSSLEEVISEWRVFVYDNHVIDVRHYDGDWSVTPDISTIHSMIGAYKSAPKAYCLDVYINAFKQRTCAMEVNHFFSCGLYGWDNPNAYLKMLTGWYQWFIRGENI